MLCRFIVKNNQDKQHPRHPKSPSTRILKNIYSSSICCFSEMYTTQGFGPQSQSILSLLYWICRSSDLQSPRWALCFCWLGRSAVVRNLWAGGAWARGEGWGLSFCWLHQRVNKNTSVISRNGMATWTNQMESLVQTAALPCSSRHSTDGID